MNTQIKKYFLEHAIPLAKVDRYGLSTTEDSISIPIFDLEGKELFRKHRHFNEKMKYTYDKGSTVALYGQHWLRFFENKEKPNVVLVEGEFDAMCLWVKEKLALSTTGGSGSWKNEWNEIIRGCPITILYDNDEAGAKGAYRVWDSLVQSGIHSKIAVVPHGFSDISEFIAKGGSLSELVTIDINTESLRTTSDKSKHKVNYNKICQDLIDAQSDVSKAIHLRWILSVFLHNIHKERCFLERKKPVSFNGDELDSIKTIPISNFIKFNNRGEAPCIFHNDKNPSMLYNNENHPKYPNTVKCFSCGTFASVIDITMVMQRVDFKGAVEYLRNFMKV